jgi:hypothetical protein
MSMLRKKLAGGIENCLSLGDSKFWYILFEFLVPGQAEVKGNEQVDRLVGTAVISDGCTMDHVDVLHALCEVGKVEDSLGDGDSNTMERLRDVQIR